MAGTVLYDRDGRVATITYNRPDARNAVNAELRQDLKRSRATVKGPADRPRAGIPRFPDAGGTGGSTATHMRLGVSGE